MKKNKLSVLLCMCVALPLFVSCGKDNVGSDFSVVESKDATVQSVPTISDSVQQRLQSVLDMEYISIPVEEWNDETLYKAVYINGAPISMPFTLHDLGAEFDVIENGEYPMAINESNHSATATITYCGIEIGSAVVSDCLSKESFSDSPISWMFLSFENFYDLDISPVSINGLGINGDYEAQKEHLYFMNLQDEDAKKNYYDYKFETENTVLMCLYTDDKMNSLTLKTQYSK